MTASAMACSNINANIPSGVSASTAGNTSGSAGNLSKSGVSAKSDSSGKSVASTGRAAIFLDRDGTLNTDFGYVCEIDQFQFIGGVIEALIALKGMGFALVLVTNQSGIARGMFSEQQFLTLTEWMDWSLADRGVDLDGIYYCPHYAQGSVAEFSQHCDCRKPKPGMLLEARDALGINMAASYMVGDKLEDMQAAQAAGIGCRVLVKSGKAITPQAQASADWLLASLAELPAAIRQHSNPPA